MAQTTATDPARDARGQTLGYKQLLRRLKRATQEGFYLEALLIEHALMEDRLRSYLYHIGALQQRTSTRVCAKTRPYLVSLVQEYCTRTDGITSEKEQVTRGAEKDEPSKPSTTPPPEAADKTRNLMLSKISDKVRIVRATLLWHMSCQKEPTEEGYLATLGRQYAVRIDAEAFLALLDQMDQWLRYRDEVIHGVRGKNFAALDGSIASRCQEGSEIARALDDQVERVKYGNVIRRSLRLKTTD